MSALPRGFDAAARQYDNMAPPDPVEIDTAEYEQQLRESNDFRTEAIGNDAQAIADAYKAKEHLPHVIDCILDDAAERVHFVLIQRDAMQLSRSETFFQDYEVPAEVIARLGKRRPG